MNAFDPISRRETAVDLTFVRPGDRFATRDDFTATIERVNGFRVEGFIDTDYTRHQAFWRQDGTGQVMCNDLVEQLPRLPEKPKGFLARIFG